MVEVFRGSKGPSAQEADEITRINRRRSASSSVKSREKRKWLGGSDRGERGKPCVVIMELN